MIDPRQHDPIEREGIALISPVPVNQLDGVMQLFAQAWWTRGRDRTKVEMILSSPQPTIGGLTPDGTLVAFVRVVTDFEFKAVVVDLIVDAPRRRAGLGRRLVEAVLDHPALARIEDFELYCDEDLVPYYEARGFELPKRTRFMRRSVPGPA